MKKLAVLFAFGTISAMAADWTGYLVDSNCAAKKAMWGNEACAQSCVKKGAKVVFVTEEDGKIYNIPDQEKVTASAGKKVTITGKLDGDTITVESVK